MRTIVLSALLLAGCTSTPSDDTGDTEDTEDTGDTGADSDSDDTGADSDTDTDTGDTADTDPPTPPTPRELARRWRLVWSDEFDGADPLDPCYDATVTPPRCMNRYWSTEACPTSTHAALADLNKCTWVVYDIYNWMDWGKPLEGKGINKLDASQVKVEGGMLHLSAMPVEDITWEPGDPWSWDCGNGGTEAEAWLVTEDCPIVAGAIHSNPDHATVVPTEPRGFAQTYGRFEVRAIIPNQMGAWPAHWLLPQGGDWPDDGEIDVMEAVAHDESDVHGSFHGGTWDGDTHVHHSLGNHHDPGEPRFATGWHVYAVEWDAAELRFFVDDLEIGHIEDGWMLPGDVLESPTAPVGSAWPAFPVEIPSLPFYWILNTSVVPTGGFSLKDFAPLEHRIDWVRVYTACTDTEVDAACLQRSTGSADVTRRAWMSADKWSAQYRVMHTGDFDGDGDDDVLLRTRSAGHATYLLRGQPRGDLLHEETLTTANGMSESAWSDAFRAGHVGDFDGDGADDLLLQGRGSGDATYLLLADGSGGFDAPLDVTNAGGMDGAKWSAAGGVVVVGDYDGDALDDVLLVAATAAHQTRLLLSQGTGFGNAQVITTAFGLDGAKWSAHDHVPHALDLDGDGHDDVLLQQKSLSPRTRWLRGGADGFQGTAADLTTFTSTTGELSASLWSHASHVLATGDFDGDGADDVLLQGRTGSDDSWLVRGGSGGVVEAGSVLGLFGLTAADWSLGRRVLHVGDVDGDGQDDVLLRSGDDRWGSRLVLGGAGGFSSAADVTSTQNLGAPQWSDDDREAALLDLDGDGQDDVLLRGRTGDDKTYVIYLP